MPQAKGRCSLLCVLFSLLIAGGVIAAFIIGIEGSDQSTTIAGSSSGASLARVSKNTEPNIAAGFSGDNLNMLTNYLKQDFLPILNMGLSNVSMFKKPYVLDKRTPTLADASVTFGPPRINKMESINMTFIRPANGGVQIAVAIEDTEIFVDKLKWTSGQNTDDIGKGAIFTMNFGMTATVKIPSIKVKLNAELTKDKKNIKLSLDNKRADLVMSESDIIFTNAGLAGGDLPKAVLDAVSDMFDACDEKVYNHQGTMVDASQGKINCVIGNALSTAWLSTGANPTTRSLAMPDQVDICINDTTAALNADGSYAQNRLSLSMEYDSLSASSNNLLAAVRVSVSVLMSDGAVFYPEDSPAAPALDVSPSLTNTNNLVAVQAQLGVLNQLVKGAHKAIPMFNSPRIQQIQDIIDKVDTDDVALAVPTLRYTNPNQNLAYKITIKEPNLSQDGAQLVAKADVAAEILIDAPKVDIGDSCARRSIIAYIVLLAVLSMLAWCCWGGASQQNENLSDMQDVDDHKCKYGDYDRKDKCGDNHKDNARDQSKWDYVCFPFVSNNSSFTLGCCSEGVCCLFKGGFSGLFKMCCDCKAMKSFFTCNNRGSIFAYVGLTSMLLLIVPAVMLPSCRARTAEAQDELIQQIADGTAPAWAKAQQTLVKVTLPLTIKVDMPVLDAATGRMSFELQPNAITLGTLSTEFPYFDRRADALLQDAVKNLQTALAPSIDTALSTNAIPAANKMIKDLLDPVSLLYKIKLPVPGLMSDPAADPVCMSVYMGKPRPNSTAFGANVTYGSVTKPLIIEDNTLKLAVAPTVDVRAGPYPAGTCENPSAVGVAGGSVLANGTSQGLGITMCTAPRLGGTLYPTTAPTFTPMTVLHAPCTSDAECATRICLAGRKDTKECCKEEGEFGGFLGTKFGMKVGCVEQPVGNGCFHDDQCDAATSMGCKGGSCASTLSEQSFCSDDRQCASRTCAFGGNKKVCCAAGNEKSSGFSSYCTNQPLAGRCYNGQHWQCQSNFCGSCSGGDCICIVPPPTPAPTPTPPTPAPTPTPTGGANKAESQECVGDSDCASNTCAVGSSKTVCCKAGSVFDSLRVKYCANQPDGAPCFRNNAQCASGSSCDINQGRCVPATASKLNEQDVCNQDSGCASGTCKWGNSVDKVCCAAGKSKSSGWSWSEYCYEQPLGGRCYDSQDWQCASGKCGSCMAKDCECVTPPATLLPDQATCSKDSECTSGTCDWGNNDDRVCCAAGKSKKSGWSWSDYCYEQPLAAVCYNSQDWQCASGKCGSCTRSNCKCV